LWARSCSQWPPKLFQNTTSARRSTRGGISHGFNTLPQWKKHLLESKPASHRIRYIRERGRVKRLATTNTQPAHTHIHTRARARTSTFQSSSHARSCVKPFAHDLHAIHKASCRSGNPKAGVAVRHHQVWRPHGVVSHPRNCCYPHDTTTHPSPLPMSTTKLFSPMLQVEHTRNMTLKLARPNRLAPYLMFCATRSHTHTHTHNTTHPCVSTRLHPRSTMTMIHDDPR